MADFFKGLAGGLETGARFGQMLREGEERKRLREAMGLTPQEIQSRQATPEEFGRAQAETQALAARDAQMFAPAPDSIERRTGFFSDNPAEGPAGGLYAPQMPVEGQRIGPTQYGLGGQTFNRMPTQQEIEAARFGAAANVIAERDPVAAMRMRQDQIRMQRENELAPLQKQQLEGSITGQGLAQQAQRITISEAERKVTQDKANRTAQTLLANMSADGMPIDTTAANRIAAETGADMTFVTDAVLKQYNLTKASANDLIERQLADFNKAAEGGIPTLNKYIAERLDPDKTDNIAPMVVQGKDGKLRVMYGNKPLPGYQSYGDINQLSAAFQGNIKRDPLGAAIQISTLQTQAQARVASEAAVRSSDSTVGLNTIKGRQTAAQTKILETNVANNEEARKIQVQLANLTDENDPTGTSRARLIDSFNMLAAGPGKTIPTAGAGKKGGSVLQTPVDLKKNDDGTYTAFSKDGGRALYNTFNGEEIPLGMEVDTYKGMKASAQKNGVGLVTGEDNGRLVIKFVGPDGKFYDDAEKAKFAKPAKSDAKPGGLDTSRTPVVQPAAEPTAPTPKPEKRSGETQPEFRARLLAWDRNRIAYERLMTEQRLRGLLSGNAAGLRRPLVE